MINAADLPAVRARTEGATVAEIQSGASAPRDAAAPAPGYPSKKLVLENGRYVVADPAK